MQPLYHVHAKGAEREIQTNSREQRKAAQIDAAVSVRPVLRLNLDMSIIFESIAQI
jgi:hypothetical protein